MNLPEKLSIELKEAESKIDSQGQLSLAVRYQLQKTIEELSLQEHENAGYFRHSRLAIACAHKNIALLDRYPAARKMADAILTNAALALSSQFELPTLESQNNKLHTEIINLINLGEAALQAVYAGMACFAACGTVLYGVDLEAQPTDQGEIDIDPDDWDAAFYGSLAESGSAAWENKGGQEARAAYWAWYLKKAVPFSFFIENPTGPVSA